MAAEKPTLRQRIQESVSALMNCTMPEVCRSRGVHDFGGLHHVTGCRREMYQDVVDRAIAAVKEYVEACETAEWRCRDCRYGFGLEMLMPATVSEEVAREAHGHRPPKQHWMSAYRLIRADDVTREDK